MNTLIQQFFNPLKAFETLVKIYDCRNSVKKALLHWSLIWHDTAFGLIMDIKHQIGISFRLLLGSFPVFEGVLRLHKEDRKKAVRVPYSSRSPRRVSKGLALKTARCQFGDKCPQTALWSLQKGPRVTRRCHFAPFGQFFNQIYLLLGDLGSKFFLVEALLQQSILSKWLFLEKNRALFYSSTWSL